MSTKLVSLDSSTTCTGISIFINGIYKDSYTIETDKKLKGDEKLDQMIVLIQDVLKKEKPDIAIYECVVPVRNPQTTRMLQELTGSIRGYCVEHYISHCSIKPSEWRGTVVKRFKRSPNGRKREDLKQWSLDIVNDELGIPTESNDQSDSILIGIGYIEMFK